MNDAQKAKERAIDRVQEARPSDYATALAAIDRVMKAKGKYSRFTSEDVILELADGYGTFQEPRVIGAAFRAVRLSGRIYASGYVHGKRKERHAAPVMEWTILRVEP